MAVRYIETLSVPVDEPQDYPGNARVHDEAWLDRTTAPGQHRSILTRRLPDGTLQILAGHGTRAAFRRKGDATVRVEVMECTDEEALAANLSDNPPPGIGGFDDAALRELLSKVEDYGMLDSSGWDKDLIDALGPEPAPVLGDVSEADDVDLTEPAEPVTQLGDLWLLGRHRLLCGDSVDKSCVKEVLNGNTPRIIYTDPPYGISIVHGDTVGGGLLAPLTKYAFVKGDESTDTASTSFSTLINLYPNSLHVWRGANHYSGDATVPNSSYWLVWDKVTGNTKFADAELAWTNHRGAVRIFRHMWNGMLRDSERGPRIHPTQKPIALAQWVFERLDPHNKCSTVLDVFGGSGSTLIACELSGRDARLIEISPAYCDVIARRWQTLTGELPFNDRFGEPVDLLATMSE